MSQKVYDYITLTKEELTAKVIEFTLAYTGQPYDKDRIQTIKSYCETLLTYHTNGNT